MRLICVPLPIHLKVPTGVVLVKHSVEVSHKLTTIAHFSAPLVHANMNPTCSPTVTLRADVEL